MNQSEVAAKSENGGTVANGDFGWVANFIWGIADDVLRDLYVRGKYRDVILPMTVLRRLDAVLEPTKKAVLGMNEKLEGEGNEQGPATSPGSWAGVLQHIEVHATRP
jgi:type I restriction-modification system DNA methylase subunit